MSQGGCCGPTETAGVRVRAVGSPAAPGEEAAGPVGPVPDLSLVSLPGGEFLMGSDAGEGEPADGEGPARPVWLSPFRIARTAVTNRQFAAFVEVTGYVTYAEEVGSSFVFAGLLPDDFPPTRGLVAAPWWRETPQACWRRPEGIGSDWRGREDHPGGHVSWHDGLAFGRW